MPDKFFKKIPKNKARKGDRIFYTRKGKKQFGYYVGKQKCHATLKKSSVVPYGSRKGQKMEAIWNPHVGGGRSSDANVFLPKNKIKKVVRGYKRKPKGKYYT